MEKRFSNQDLRKLIIPLFLEQLLVMLVGIADTFMVSFAGDAAVSGVSLVNMLVTFFIYVFTALASGGAVIVSQYIGKKERENADHTAGQLLLVSVLVSAFCMLFVLIWNEQMVRLLFGRVEKDVMAACVSYQRIMAFSYVPLGVYNAGTAICRSISRTEVTLKISIVVNIINVLAMQSESLSFMLVWRALHGLPFWQGFSPLSLSLYFVSIKRMKSVTAGNTFLHGVRRQ